MKTSRYERLGRKMEMVAGFGGLKDLLWLPTTISNRFERSLDERWERGWYHSDSNDEVGVPYFFLS